MTGTLMDPIDLAVYDILKRDTEKVEKRELPQYFNWVEQGFVTTTMDQGVCLI